MRKIFLTLGLILFSTVTIAANSFFESDIYFGLSKNNGQIISENDFNKFKNEQITKRFTSGFTMENAQGVWFSKKQGVILEPSKVVIIVYQASKKNILKIKAMADEYKKRFNQESVLVVTKKVDVNFY